MVILTAITNQLDQVRMPKLAKKIDLRLRGSEKQMSKLCKHKDSFFWGGVSLRSETYKPFAVALKAFFVKNLDSNRE